MRRIPLECRATIGSVSNHLAKFVNLGKAGANRQRGRRPKVGLTLYVSTSSCFYILGLGCAFWDAGVAARMLQFFIVVGKAIRVVARTGASRWTVPQDYMQVTYVPCLGTA